MKTDGYRQKRALKIMKERQRQIYKEGNKQKERKVDTHTHIQRGWEGEIKQNAVL